MNWCLLWGNRSLLMLESVTVLYHSEPTAQNYSVKKPSRRPTAGLWQGGKFSFAPIITLTSSNTSGERDVMHGTYIQVFIKNQPNKQTNKKLLGFNFPFPVGIPCPWHGGNSSQSCLYPCWYWQVQNCSLNKLDGCALICWQEIKQLSRPVVQDLLMWKHKPNLLAIEVLFLLQPWLDVFSWQAVSLCCVHQKCNSAVCGDIRWHPSEHHLTRARNLDIFAMSNFPGKVCSEEAASCPSPAARIKVRIVQQVPSFHHGELTSLVLPTCCVGTYKLGGESEVPSSAWIATTNRHIREILCDKHANR